MRILCVSADHPPHRAGGYELQCAAAVGHLRRHGHEVEVLTSARPGAPDSGAADRRERVFRDLRRFPAVPEPTSLREAWRGERHNAAALAAHVRRFRPDAICWWRLGELSQSLPERARRAGVPAVGVVCDPWMVDGPARDPWARRRRRPPRLPGDTRWLFVSQALRRRVLEAGVRVVPAGVVPAGIELGSLPLAPARPWSGRLLYAGRLSPLKGVDVAVRALALLPPPATLDVVGDGDTGWAVELRQLAVALGVGGRVRFHGARPHSGMAAAYAGADAVLFPSRWAEPWGLVPLEAMATGRPVVATGTGGSAEYLRADVNALVVAPGDAPALAAAVRRLAGDAGLRDRLRVAGRRTAEAHPAERAHAAVRHALEAAAPAPLTRAAPVKRSA